MSQKTFVVSPRALLRNPNGKYLFLQRADTVQHDPGKWELPGGKPDPNEEFETTLLREIQEETGLSDVVLERQAFTLESEIAGKRLITVVMEGRTSGEGVVLRESEHQRFEWKDDGDIQASTGVKFPLAPLYAQVWLQAKEEKAETEADRMIREKADREWLHGQVALYAEREPLYKAYAHFLRNLFKSHGGDAFHFEVASRAKSLPSFAEKALRKRAKYERPADQFGDLCGARVVVHTQDQIQAVEGFVLHHFFVLQREDVAERLGEEAFGYRGTHLNVRPDPGKLEGKPGWDGRFAQLEAELQVRTMAMNAWADILHDREYKATLRIPPDLKRSGRRLAALFEEGDATILHVVRRSDEMSANYQGYAPAGSVQEEIRLLNRLLELQKAKRADAAKEEQAELTGDLAQLSLRRARLLNALRDPVAHGDVAADLKPLVTGWSDASRGERLNDLKLELGIALSGVPGQEEEGWSLLREQARRKTSYASIPDLRHERARRARAAHHLAHALRKEPRHSSEAYRAFQQAHQEEPENPYYLADMLGFAGDANILPAVRTLLAAAASRCEEHAAHDIEVPSCYFTAARLLLLQGKDAQATRYYAKGIHHLVLHAGGGKKEERAAAARKCVQLLAEEENWLAQVNGVRHEPSTGMNRMKRLFALGTCLLQKRPLAGEGKLADKPRILIAAGGAGSMTPRDCDIFAKLLSTALSTFRGVVITGGTRAGVSQVVGDLFGVHGKAGCGYSVVGVLASGEKERSLSHADITERWVDLDPEFSVSQVLLYWEHIFRAGVPDTSRLKLLGYGGGPIAAVEYRLALLFGAKVGILVGSGGEADLLLADPLWKKHPNLVPLPLEEPTVRAFLDCDEAEWATSGDLLKIAQALHRRYLGDQRKKIHEPHRPWPDLPPTFRTANRAQAGYIAKILASEGYRVVKSGSTASPVTQFPAPELERMARLEHGRWNVERLSDGWRYGPRDDSKKIHDCLRPWEDLSREIQGYDTEAVRKFPEFLAALGWAVEKA